MKTIETILPATSVQSTVDKLLGLAVSEVTVEPIRVFKKGLHRLLIHRGCEYEQNFIAGSKLHFLVSDEDKSRAETIITDAAHV